MEEIFMNLLCLYFINILWSCVFAAFIMYQPLYGNLTIISILLIAFSYKENLVILHCLQRKAQLIKCANDLFLQVEPCIYCPQPSRANWSITITVVTFVQNIKHYKNGEKCTEIQSVKPYWDNRVCFLYSFTVQGSLTSSVISLSEHIAMITNKKRPIARHTSLIKRTRLKKGAILYNFCTDKLYAFISISSQYS